MMNDDPDQFRTTSDHWSWKEEKAKLALSLPVYFFEKYSRFPLKLFKHAFNQIALSGFCMICIDPSID